MRAIRIDRFGAPDEMTLREIDAPAPGPGEVQVEVSLAGLNFIDIYMRNGTYAKSQTYRTPLPMGLGMEGVGRVSALGEGVTGVAPGDRVAWCLSRGSYAQYACVPAWRAVPVPGGVSDEVAVTLMLQGCTAHYLAHSAFALEPGDTCLVHAAAGGVGQLLTQVARLRGARVIATVGSEEKAAIARARGADEVILYRTQDFRDEVRRLTGGRGVDVVYDSVGIDTIARSIRSLRRRGTCILYGASSGPVPSIEPIELGEAGSVFFTRPHLADYTADREEILRRTGDLFRWAGEGRLKVTIDRVFPLEEAADAHRFLEAGESRGKLLLRVR
ncbi:MAG: quinone oxidoreductase [Burkholderiaceae bacterium]|nr:quinone oxidoreductase [Burkholderiaceae bacterium]